MLVVDVEASGLNSERHSILSIGAFDFDNPEARFYKECQIWPGAEIDSESLVITGFSIEEAKDPDKPDEAEITRAFLEWSQHLSDRTILGQNPSFDRDFLIAAAHRAHLAWDLAHRTLDTHTLCFMHMIKRGLPAPIDPQHRRSALNLEAVLNYCGLPAEPDPHNALTGAMCHGEVASRLLYGKNLLPEFAEFPIPW